MIDLNELKDTEINGDINQLIFLNTNQKKAISVASTYAQFIAKLVDVLLINDDVRNKKEELTTLMKLIMELFLINYLSPTLMRSAIKNLNNDYQKKVDAVVCQLAYITKIHKLLKSLLPNNINELVILINQLLKPINK
jgi:hypothetical protein